VPWACLRTRLPLRRESFMPTRVLTVRRLVPALALTLCLAVADRTSAKPPDLPRPTTADFVPADKTDVVPFYAPLIEPVSPPLVGQSEESDNSATASQTSALVHDFVVWLFGASFTPPAYDPREAYDSSEEAEPEALPVKPAEVTPP